MPTVSNADFVALVLEKTESGALKWSPFTETTGYKVLWSVLPTSQALHLSRTDVQDDQRNRLEQYLLELRDGDANTPIEFGEGRATLLTELWSAIENQGGMEIEKAMCALNELGERCELHPPPQPTSKRPLHRLRELIGI